MLVKILALVCQREGKELKMDGRRESGSGEGEGDMKIGK